VPYYIWLADWLLTFEVVDSLYDLSVTAVGGGVNFLFFNNFISTWLSEDSDSERTLMRDIPAPRATTPSSYPNSSRPLPLSIFLTAPKPHPLKAAISYPVANPCLFLKLLNSYVVGPKLGINIHIRKCVSISLKIMIIISDSILIP